MFRAATGLALALLAQATLAANPAQLEARQVTNPDGSPAPTQVFINGEITPGISQQLARALGRNQIASATVYLHSAGGDLQAAMELGKLIRKMGFNTAVGKREGDRIAAGSCNSACLSVLAGGVFRYADERSHLGIHRFYSTETRPTDLATGQIIAASLIGHFTDMGVDPALFELMVGAGSEIQKLDVRESVRLRLLNQGMEPSSWDIQGRNGRIFLAGSQNTDAGKAEIEVSCDTARRTVLRASFTPSAKPKHAHGGDGQAIVINNSLIPNQNNTGSFQQDAFKGEFELNRNHAAQMKSASQLGFAWYFQSGSESVKFSIPTGQNGDKIFSFLSHCQGR